MKDYLSTRENNIIRKRLMPALPLTQAIYLVFSLKSGLK